MSEENGGFDGGHGGEVRSNRGLSPVVLVCPRLFSGCRGLSPFLYFEQESMDMTSKTELNTKLLLSVCVKNKELLCQ